MRQFKVLPFDVGHSRRGLQVSLFQVEQHLGDVVDLLLLLFGLTLLALDAGLKGLEPKQGDRDQLGGVWVVHLGLGPHPRIHPHLWGLAIFLDLLRCE